MSQPIEESAQSRPAASSGPIVKNMLFAAIAALMATLLAGGHWVGDLLAANEALAEKNGALAKEVEALQLANQKLAEQHRLQLGELNLNHVREKAQIKARAKAKAKIQRGIASVPVAGLASLAIFEKMEFDEWRQDHPQGTVEDYYSEMMEHTKNLLAEEYSRFVEHSDTIMRQRL